MLIEKTSDYTNPTKCAVLKEVPGVKLTNFTSGKRITDHLHFQSAPITCSESSCKGALMKGLSSKPERRTEQEVLEEAFKFQQLYLASIKNSKPEDLSNRMKVVQEELSKTGVYTLTADELQFGSKTAWRNASRCIGRIQWNKLHLNDYRHATTTHEMFDGLCKHLEYASNGGNIRSTITLFPPSIEGREDFRVWNAQLIGFAGYLQPDGSIMGDPARLQFTRICQRLGWKGKGGRFDILPWVLYAPGEGVRFYDIPEELVLMVELEHPKFPWFKDLGLKWYAVPAVSDMTLDVGGLSFTAAPFNGWYMSTEIGARNLCDMQRYNVAMEVAEKMGLDTVTHSTMWKDIALVETTLAVLHTFQKQKVTIVDHHTAAETFMKHMEVELRSRGGCPADWVWIVPPISGSSTPVFHQEMINYNLKPSFEYQDKAWVTYKWPKNPNVKLKYSLRNVIRAVRICLAMMSRVRKNRVEATILYASETGKSETFARKLGSVLYASFNTKVMCMDDYDCEDLPSENLVIVVASTFGTGEPPDNGKAFWKNLKDMKQKNISLDSLKYAVFALGSSQYPNFCNFGKNVDKMLLDLGGKRVSPLGIGDELGGQERSFATWLPAVYKASCRDFNIDWSDDAVPSMDISTWKKDQFRLVETTIPEKPVPSELSKLHNKKLFCLRVLLKSNLQSPNSDRQTILARLGVQDGVLSSYEPGDHIAVFPTNSATVVERILDHMKKSETRIDAVVQTESLKDGFWEAYKRLPAATIRSYLSHYLDITTPPSANFLLLLSQMATGVSDKIALQKLSENSDEYEMWKSFRHPNLAEVLEEFPSIQLDPTLLVSELPLLQPRYYSISSSRKVTPEEIHITFSLVSYKTQNDTGNIHYGVCTSFLQTVTDRNIPCFIRSAPRFRLPEDPATPVIMVGAGSGIAPFRSFWQEREALFQTPQQLKTSSPLGNMFLFFGCRQSNTDNIYQDETIALVNKGVLTKVFTALSREPGQAKEYVQHRLAKESSVVLDVLKHGGHIYVCGDAVMASDVRDTISEILSKNQINTDLDTLIDSGRYHEDVFGVLHKK